MTVRVVEQVDDWESRAFSGGYGGLHDLSDDEFSGIVTVGPTRLCMTKGTVIGILDGDIEDFEDGSGTVYEAPSPALPLLAVMQERGDEVRAQYYTEETPLSEVDRTLTDGNFTGYVELSENVLSGDYYQVYHQGRSMSVAFVGASDQRITGDEAFETANDEVGIYKVRQVDIDPVEIPEPADASTGGGAAAGGTDAASNDTADEAAPTADEETGGADEADVEASVSAAETDDEPAASTTEDRPRGATAEAGGPADEQSEPSTAHRQRGDDRPATEASARSDGAEPAEPTTDRSRADTVQSSDTTSQPTAGQQDGAETERPGAGRSQQSAASQRPPAGAGADPTESASTAGSASGSAGDRSGEVGSVSRFETRSIPSLDPDRTNESESGSGATPTAESNGSTAGAAESTGQPTSATTTSGPSPQPSDGQPNGGNGSRADSQSQGGQPAGRGDAGAQRAAPGDGGGAVSAESVEQLEAALAEREAEVDRLERELERVEGERDDLAAELESVTRERDELRERVEELEQRLDELQAGEGGAVAGRQRLSPAEAIDGTNLFVRYNSKGDATLEAAHEGRAEASAVNDNLEIQHHTQFEADDVAVDGEPFVDFLRGTLQYRFVRWVVRTLPYEIRDTGHEGALKDLYDALPSIDRAELNGTVTVAYEEDGEQHRSQESFDIVLRDRMGNPLVVTNLNESRDPASQSMMESLITASQRVGESKGSLVGSFLVTASFFAPEAMEAAADATGGGLLSRDKRESFVKLSRKDGFHLCLVEARGENFTLSVPEI